MGSRWSLAFGTLIIFALSPAPAGAAEEGDLEEALRALEAAAAQDPNLSPAFKSAIQDVSDALRAREARSVAMPPVSAPEESFWDRVHGFADMRLRGESDTREDNGNRRRARVRFRFGANVDVTDELVAGFRVRTGNPDRPRSPYKDLGDELDSWEFNLDRVYAKYSPKWFEGAWIEGGKFGNPFVTNPVYGELVWDADLNPEGAAAGYRFRNAAFEAGVIGSAYVLLDLRDAGHTNLYTGQGYVEARTSDGLEGRISTGAYGYNHLNRSGNTDLSTKPGGGNLIGPASEFVSDFRIVDTVASVSCDCLGLPLTLAGEYIVNTEAVGPDDEGFALGAATKVRFLERQHKIYYQYQYVEQESVFALFAQDDFTRATDLKGHLFGIDFSLANGVGLRTWGMLAEPVSRPASGGRDDDLRLRIDLDLRF